MTVDALRFDGVNKSFLVRNSEFAPVLRDISLAVAPGQSVAILGPSGSGKSTLLRLAAGLERLTGRDAGVISVGGHIPGDPRPRSAFVFQSYSTFPWLNAERNVMLALRQAKVPRAERRARATDLLANVRLGGLEHNFPDQLSGGQRQRLAFACAIALRPTLLLLDEPMGALDLITREHLQFELIRLWCTERCAMILVTHDIAEAVLLGERVLLLSDRPGCIVLELDTSHEKPWRDTAVSPEALAAMMRAYRATPEFLHLTNRLRDALAGSEGLV